MVPGAVHAQAQGACALTVRCFWPAIVRHMRWKSKKRMTASITVAGV